MTRFVFGRKKLAKIISIPTCWVINLFPPQGIIEVCMHPKVLDNNKYTQTFINLLLKLLKYKIEKI